MNTSQNLTVPTSQQPIAIREFGFGSPSYLAALDLRDRGLRIPLGLSLSDIDTTNEATQRSMEKHLVSSRRR